MVSPIKTPGYSQVPNPQGQGSPTFSNNSPNPGTTSPNPDMLSPEMHDRALLGRRGSEMYPAPSLMSRDSTFASIPGTPGDNRSSWGSAALLSGLAGGAEAEVSGCVLYITGKLTLARTRTVQPRTLFARVEQYRRRATVSGSCCTPPCHQRKDTSMGYQR